jgi:hypothetical protein
LFPCSCSHFYSYSFSDSYSSSYCPLDTGSIKKARWRVGRRQLDNIYIYIIYIIHILYIFYAENCVVDRDAAAAGQPSHPVIQELGPGAP